MTQLDGDILTQAINRNSAAVFELPSAGMTRYHKTRFLRCEHDRLWLESVSTERPLIESLVQSGESVAVTFKTGHRTATFSSPIVELDDSYRFFDAQGPVHAVLMNRPSIVKPLQRRTYYRVPVREEDAFRIQTWRISEHVALKDEPPELGHIEASVHDLSVGGVGVIFAKKPVLIAEQRMRLLLTCGQEPVMLLEGRTGQVRKLKNSDRYETGIRFQGLQDSLPGRQMLTDLTRIVSTLQLREAKRIRSMAG